MNETGKLDKEAIESALDAMAVLAARDGLVLDLAVYGGSCLMLASNIRDASEDVDGVYLSNADDAARIAGRVAMEHGLSAGWLNQAAKQFAPPVSPLHSKEQIASSSVHAESDRRSR